MSRITRLALLLAAPFVVLGAECDFGDLVNALCDHDADHPECPAQEKVVFRTSTLHTGDVGGLAGADAICNDLAAASPLAGKTFAAWLSTSTVDARDRLVEPGDGGFVRTDGVPVASSIADLTDGEIENPITRDENGAIPPVVVAWTGTRDDGTVHVFGFPRTCSDWTDASGSGLIGRTSDTSTWTQFGSTTCSSNFHLYCFEI